MNTKTVEIDINGKHIKVICPEGQEDLLKQAATDLEERYIELQQRSNTYREDKILTIVALNYCHELKSLKEEHNKSNEELKQRLKNLDSKLNKVLNKDNFID